MSQEGGAVDGGDDDDGSDEESESDEGGGGEYQQNNMAFKSYEIDQGLMRDEIFAIRNHKWTTMANIQDEYDFGLLLLDCRPLKIEIINHCDALLAVLEKYIIEEF